MTPHDLKARCGRLFGEFGWQVRLARALGINPSTVQRWLTGATDVPESTAALIEFLELTPKAFWPARWFR